MAIVNRRMKVMHIISGDLWAGAEVQAYTLLKELRTDCDLHVILMNPGELADRLKALAIPVTLLDESKLNPVKILLGMRKTMLSFRPDIIHTHRQKENILGAIANLLSVRAKSVRTSHGAPEFSAKGMQKIQVYMDCFVGKYMQNAIIAVSIELASKLNRLYPFKKIHTINNGVDVESLKSRSDEEADFRLIEPGAYHIGIIGRLEVVKRVDIFLHIAAILLSKDLPRPIRFHVIGEGKLRPVLEQTARQLNIDADVIFHGHRQDIPRCINSLDAVVMCSDHEGTPMVALEAMALGRPLIGHNVGGLQEILKAFPDLLVSNHVASSYAQQLLMVLEHNGEYRVSLAPHYSSKVNAKKVKTLYMNLLIYKPKESKS